MKREKRIPSRSLLLENEVTEVKRLVKSEIILKELSTVKQSTPFNDGGYGKEVIKNTLISLIKKDAINNDNISDCIILIDKLSLGYIIDVVNMLNDRTIMFESHLNRHLEDKELYAYEEDYILSKGFPVIKSKLINETLIKKKNLIPTQRYYRRVLKGNYTIDESNDEYRSIYDSEYYNDGLDIDQQSQEFWEDIL